MIRLVHFILVFAFSAVNALTMENVSLDEVPGFRYGIWMNDT